jgi:hypothetical protein
MARYLWDSAILIFPVYLTFPRSFPFVLIGVKAAWDNRRREHSCIRSAVVSISYIPVLLEYLFFVRTIIPQGGRYVILKIAFYL